MELTDSDSDSSDISITYSDGEVVCCLQYSDDNDDPEKTLYMKGISRSHRLKSGDLTEEEREDITRILLRKSPCSFLIHAHKTTAFVKDVDIVNTLFITTGQYSIVYVTQSLLDDMKKTHVQSIGKICDICIFTSERPTLILTLVEDGKDGEDDNVYYNTHLARMLTRLVRKEALNNYSVVSGVISKEKFTTRQEFEKFMAKRTKEAFKLAMPYSLDMDTERWSAIVTCFMTRIFSCNADTSILAVPVGQVSKLLPVVEFETTTEECSEEASDSSDPCDQERPFLWDLKRYRLKSHLPVGPPINIVLVGRLGNGKSATANTIFGQQVCDESLDPEPDKQRCQLHHGVVGGREIKLVDTVGRMDPENTRKMLEEIGSAIFLCPEGFDAIVIVLRLTRIQDDEKKAIENLKRLFRDQGLVRRYGVVVFTGGDMCKIDMPFQDYIQKKGDAFVKKLVRECENRALLFNNKISPHDYKESEKQVIALVKEIDKLSHKVAFKKYKNPSFDDAYGYHQNIEESNQKQRLMFDRERTVFEEKLRQEGSREKKRQEKELTAKAKELEKHVTVEKDILKTEMQAYIREKRSNVKTQLDLNLKQENDKMQRDWLSQLEMTNKTHAAELNRLVEDDYKVQSAKWDYLMQEETRAVKTEVDEVLKGKQQDDYRKGFLKSKFDDVIQERKKLIDIQWKKTCRETLRVQAESLKKQIDYENMENEDEWKKTYTSKCVEYMEHFNNETDLIIRKAKSEVDLQVKHLKLDSYWRKEMELLKERLKLKWSAFYPVNWNPEYTWTDDLLEKRKRWETNCQVVFERKLEEAFKDIKECLNEERQRLEKLYIVEIHQKGKGHFEIVRDEFGDPEKWINVEQVMKVLSLELTDEEITWKQSSQTKMEELCSTQEKEWNSKEMDLSLQLNEKELETDISNRIMSHTTQTDIIRECWNKSVKYLLDEKYLKYMKTISDLESETKTKWLKDVTNMYSGKVGQLIEKEEKLKEVWKLDDKENTLRELIKDADKLDKALAYWRSFERDWYNIAACERSKFEARWNMILTEISSQHLFPVEAEASNIWDTIGKRMENLRMEQEENWRLERNGLCLSHLDHFKQEEMKSIIDRETERYKDNLKNEIQELNKEWRQEANDFLALKEICWNACVEIESGVLRDKFKNIIETHMQTEDENWRGTAIKECSILLAEWKQDLQTKRVLEETAWLEKLKQLRQKREFEWEMELKVIGRRWNKSISDCIEDEMKVSKKALDKNTLDNRKQAEAKWEEANQQLIEMVTKDALMEATRKAEENRREKLKIIQDRREIEEEKWHINLKWTRLEMEEHRLNEILTEIFENKFADSNKCFPSTSKVITKGGREIEMSNLQKGQYVLCSTRRGSLVYSDVFRFGHRTEEGQHIFVNISTKTQSLKLSPNHHVILGAQSFVESVPVGPTGTKAAADVEMGDMLLVYDKERQHLFVEAVVGVSLVTESGLYAPYTHSGNIIVDCVLASCYVNRVKPCLAHVLLAPVRLFHRLKSRIARLCN